MVHPSWGDAFVNEWVALYTNIDQRRWPKTSLADYRQDLLLFQAMAGLMLTGDGIAGDGVSLRHPVTRLSCYLLISPNCRLST